MTLWIIYHTNFSVTATSTVSYIMPMVWYAHFIDYSKAKLYKHLILVTVVEKLKKVYKGVISDLESERTVSQWIQLWQIF